MSYLLYSHLHTARAELIKARTSARWDNPSPEDLLELRSLVSECLAELAIVKLALSNRPFALQTDRMDSDEPTPLKRP